MPNKIKPDTLQAYNSSVTHNTLIKNIKQYLILRSRKHSELNLNRNSKSYLSYDELISFNTNEGLCAGLVAFCLYSIRSGKHGRYAELFQYVHDWQAKDYLKSDIVEDPQLEEFINIVFFLQVDNRLRHGVLQTDWQNSFGLLIDEQVIKQEFDCTFVFDAETLFTRLEQLVRTGKMVRFGNGQHAVGLILYNDKYYFINPSVELEVCTDLEHAAQAIIESLKVFGQQGNYQALNIRIFDLDNEMQINYPDKFQFYAEIIRDMGVKDLIINNPYPFHLAAANHDFETLDFLRAEGFVHKPWTASMNTELHNAIISRSEKMLDYLLSAGLPVNFARADSLTPLGLAINHDNFNMICMLLAAGADPNLDVDRTIKNFKPLNFALATAKDKDTIAVLLGHGAKLTNLTRRLLASKFSAADLSLIYANAEIIRNHQQSYLEKSRLYHLIHDPQRALNVWQLRTLLQDLNHILPSMLSKPLSEQTDADLRELAIIVRIIKDLAQTKSLSPGLKLISLSAAKCTAQIQSYLQANGVDSLDTYLALHPSVKSYRDGVYFATNSSEITPIAYTNSVFQLLKL